VAAPLEQLVLPIEENQVGDETIQNIANLDLSGIMPLHSGVQISPLKEFQERLLVSLVFLQLSSPQLNSIPFPFNLSERIR
jgi:hypothetical protein